MTKPTCQESLSIYAYESYIMIGTTDRPFIPEEVVRLKIEVFMQQAEFFVDTRPPNEIGEELKTQYQQAYVAIRNGCTATTIFKFNTHKYVSNLQVRNDASQTERGLLVTGDESIAFPTIPSVHVHINTYPEAPILNSIMRLAQKHFPNRKKCDIFICPI